MTTANDLERVLQHVNEGPAIRLPAFVRERIASKALQACSEADAWLASQLSAGQGMGAEDTAETIAANSLEH